MDRDPTRVSSPTTAGGGAGSSEVGLFVDTDRHVEGERGREFSLGVPGRW